MIKLLKYLMIVYLPHDLDAIDPCENYELECEQCGGNGGIHDLCVLGWWLSVVMIVIHIYIAIDSILFKICIYNYFYF